MSNVIYIDEYKLSVLNGGTSDLIKTYIGTSAKSNSKYINILIASLERLLLEFKKDSREEISIKKIKKHRVIGDSIETEFRSMDALLEFANLYQFQIIHHGLEVNIKDERTKQVHRKYRVERSRRNYKFNSEYL